MNEKVNEGLVVIPAGVGKGYDRRRSITGASAALAAIALASRPFADQQKNSGSDSEL